MLEDEPVVLFETDNIVGSEYIFCEVWWWVCVGMFVGDGCWNTSDSTSMVSASAKLNEETKRGKEEKEKKRERREK